MAGEKRTEKITIEKSERITSLVTTHGEIEVSAYASSTQLNSRGPRSKESLSDKYQDPPTPSSRRARSDRAQVGGKVICATKACSKAFGVPVTVQKREARQASRGGPKASQCAESPSQLDLSCRQPRRFAPPPSQSSAQDPKVQARQARYGGGTPDDQPLITCVTEECFNALGSPWTNQTRQARRGGTEPSQRDYRQPKASNRPPGEWYWIPMSSRLDDPKVHARQARSGGGTPDDQPLITCVTEECFNALGSPWTNQTRQARRGGTEPSQRDPKVHARQARSGGGTPDDQPLITCVTEECFNALGSPWTNQTRQARRGGTEPSQRVQSRNQQNISSSQHRFAPLPEQSPDQLFPEDEEIQVDASLYGDTTGRWMYNNPTDHNDSCPDAQPRTGRSAARLQSYPEDEDIQPVTPDNTPGRWMYNNPTVYSDSCPEAEPRTGRSAAQLQAYDASTRSGRSGVPTQSQEYEMYNNCFPDAQPRAGRSAERIQVQDPSLYNNSSPDYWAEDGRSVCEAPPRSGRSGVPAQVDICAGRQPRGGVE